MKKILVIKLGHSETLGEKSSETPSLGDVLRTTFVLHFFKKKLIYWLVDKSAVPLLKHNKRIDKICIYNTSSLKKLKKERFFAVLNLEKSDDMCKLSGLLRADFYFGFTSAAEKMKMQGSFKGCEKLLQVSTDIKARRRNRDSWQKVLAEALNKKWNGQRYVLGYKPKSKIRYDVGLNWTTGPKWKNKSWPLTHWQELEHLLKKDYSVSWQKGQKNLYRYIDWINACRLIVTADTLGLHIALALRKRVIALFGPTPHTEIDFYRCGAAMLPAANYRCIPCLKTFCDKKNPCMRFISPQRVRTKVKHEFKKNLVSSKL